MKKYVQYIKSKKKELRGKKTILPSFNFTWKKKIGLSFSSLS